MGWTAEPRSHEAACVPDRRTIAQHLRDLSVTEVCFAVGCSSLGTFGTRFTELVGVPPSVYRRQAARDGRDVVLRGETGDRTDQESRSASTGPRVDFLAGRSRTWESPNRRER